MSRGSWTMCNLLAEELKDPWNHFFVLCILSQKGFRKILTAEIRDFYEGKGASWRRGQTTGTIEV